MRTGTRWIGGIATGVVVAAGGLATIAAASGDDNEPAIEGAALERASAAALKHVGGGKVTETEIGDEEGYYEVEVTLDDGSQVDVHLDKQFTVLADESDGADDEGAGDD